MFRIAMRKRMIMLNFTKDTNVIAIYISIEPSLKVN